jgi:hypothetical protein
MLNSSWPENNLSRCLSAAPITYSVGPPFLGAVRGWWSHNSMSCSLLFTYVHSTQHTAHPSCLHSPFSSTSAFFSIQHVPISPSFLQPPSTSYTVKKGLTTFPSPGGISLTKLSLVGNNLIASESLISDVPAGDGKIAKNFLQCTKKMRLSRLFLSPLLYSILYSTFPLGFNLSAWLRHLPSHLSLKGQYHEIFAFRFFS